MGASPQEQFPKVEGVESNVDVEKLVANYPWKGSWFPRDEAFATLSKEIPEADHDKLRELINKRAAEHDATLE